MRLFQQAGYKFIERRRGAYVISAIFLAVSIGAMVFNIFGIGSWVNYGVDFTGGALIQVRVPPEVTENEIRNALGGTQAPQVTEFGDDSTYVIRAALVGDQAVEQIAEGIRAQLEASPEIPRIDIRAQELVGPKVGAELTRQAGLAILFSFVLTLLYLWIRFELRFGLAAVIATVHDILITLGFLALFRIEIALPTVAALLTIVGYSLNDTIVVFDRIRENLGARGARKEAESDLVNRSINETLPRTVLTSGTTLAVLLALLLVGGAVVRDFTLVLILGVVIGTYSSIFVASPALLEIRKRLGEGKPRERKKAEAGEPVAP